MSLRVWLPLNGDLKNQGMNNYTPTLVSDNTWAASGKTGNKSLTLIKLQTILPTSSCMTGAKEISYCYWVKVNTAWSANWLDGIRWTETNGSATATARQEFYTNCTLIGTWYKGGSISGKSFTPGKWTHLAATFNYNTGEVKFYINGTLSGSTTNLDTTYRCRGDFYIGDNGTDICENDVRIYDHCLSAAEVKEIAQGLILHYKLNDGYIESAKNLCTTDTLGNNAYNGATGKYSYGTTTDMYKTIITRQDCGECTQVKMGTAGLSAYPYVWFDNIHPRQNEYRTLSFDYYPTSQTSVVFYTYSGSATAIYTVNYGPSQTGSTIPVILNQWNHITLTLLGTSANTSGWGYMRIGSAAHTSTTTDYWLFNNIQVELNNHATPYTNNERLSNNLNISTNNLITGLTAGGRTTISGSTVTTTGTNADTYFYLKLSTPMIKNHLYKLSCNVSGLANDGYWSFPIAGQSNTTIPAFVLKNGYNELIFRANDNCVSAGNSVIMDDNGATSRTVVMTINNFKLVDVTPIIYDSSGFSNNGTIVGEFNMNIASPRYDKSLYLHSIDPTTNSEKGISYIQTPLSLTTPLQLSFVWWAKPESGYGGSSNHAAFCTSNQIISPTDYNTTAFHHRDAGFDIYSNDGSGVKHLSFTYTLNQWHHYAVTYDGTTARAYQDGELKSSIEVGANKTLASFSQLYIGLSKAGGVWRKTLGSYSDFRVYVTQLLDTDIKQLYNVSMKVDKEQNVHAFEGKEQLFNIMYRPNFAIGAQLWQDGLSCYTQTNCQVNLTNDGLHIYRPANLNQTDNGSTMYGGLKIVNSTTDNVHSYNPDIDNIFNLQKGHTYIWIFHVKGNTTNAPSFQINNNMGWGGGGLTPAPSDVTTKNISSNFNGETEVWYKFTINDEIVKTCTSAYSSFVANNQYLSYKHFGWNWQYGATGNGTDIYITNIRLYDITNMPIGKIMKNGIIKFSSIFEVNNTIHLTKNEDLILNQFIER